MQAIIIDLVTLGLMVFLFAVIARVRPDGRFRCWVVGWLLVMVHFAVELWQPTSLPLADLQSCISIDLLAGAGISFAISTLQARMDRRRCLGMAAWLTVSTLTCINLAIIGVRSVDVIVAAILVRQAGCLIGMRPLLGQRSRALATLAAMVESLWMIDSLLHGHPEVVVVALLLETFLLTAIEFWFNYEPRGVALTTVSVGMVGWGLVFPAALMMERFLPAVNVEAGFWNVPKLCVAVGMILLVLEEDTRASRQLSDESQLLFENNPHSMWIFDLETRECLNVNQSALAKHGYTREEFLGRKVTDLLHPEDVERVQREICCRGSFCSTSARHLKKDGSVLAVDITAYDTTFHGRRSRFVLAIDVTQRELLHEQLVHQAQHDSLTGLPNRLLLHDRVEQALAQSKRSREKFAVLCVDIDRFKHINDTYGHHVGDLCLQAVATRLKHRLRAVDTIARTGGEEFVIVVPGLASAQTAEAVAQELVALFNEPLEVNGYEIRLTLSVGVSVYPDDASETISLWRDADRAQYIAKGRGGNQIVWVSKQLSRESQEEAELEAHMRRSIEVGGFHLHYQPLYSFDGRVHGMEALLRLSHPTLGNVSPARFIPIAEETGLIVPIGEWVIGEVCRQMAEWRDAGASLLPVAVNVSARQFVRAGFAEFVVSTIDSYGLRPELIELELTESTLMRNLGDVSEQMNLLSAADVKFSIDDFGTGYSSLARLHQLPLSVLKIDRSFTHRLCDASGTYSIVQAIISMAHTLGMRVIAEGVECEEQVACLRTLECDYLQGFLLSRPVSPEQIPGLMSCAHALLSTAVNACLPGPSATMKQAEKSIGRQTVLVN